MNPKSIKECDAIKRAQDQGFITDEVRRPKLYLGENDHDFVSLDGSKGYDIKSVVQEGNQTYKNSADNVIENIMGQINDALGKDKADDIPYYIIDLKSVPNFLQPDIAQYIQNQLQKAPYLNEFNFLFN